MTSELRWPVCVCGHIAQDHNCPIDRKPDDYGCDICECPIYRFPATTTPERRAALLLQRRIIINRTATDESYEGICNVPKDKDKDKP